MYIFFLKNPLSGFYKNEMSIYFLSVTEINKNLQYDTLSVVKFRFMNRYTQYIQYQLLIVILLFPFQTFGKHLIGGEMSYKCLGNGDYEIELSIYRDCLSDGADFDAEVTFAVYQCDNTIDCSALMQGSQGFSFAVPLTEKKAISPPDPTCVLPQLCVEQGIYRFRFSDFDVFLPNTNNSYHIVYPVSYTHLTLPTTPYV